MIVFTRRITLSPAQLATVKQSLVARLDWLDASEMIANEPDESYPMVLTHWIRQDQLQCLKGKVQIMRPGG